MPQLNLPSGAGGLKWVEKIHPGLVVAGSDLYNRSDHEFSPSGGLYFVLGQVTLYASDTWRTSEPLATTHLDTAWCRGASSTEVQQATFGTAFP